MKKKNDAQVPMVEIFPKKLNLDMRLVSTLAKGSPSVKFLFKFERVC